MAIVGAPFDDAVTHRSGARFGPRAIREAQYTAGSIYSLQVDIDPYDHLTVVDAGDANIIPSWIERGHAMIYRKVGEVAATGAIPIILGGDHSITWPAATAIAELRRPRTIGIVHFDAHADTANKSYGVLASHGTPMRRLIESGAVQGRNFVQVGLRGYWPPKATFEWMQAQGMRWHFMREIEERGAEAVIADAIAEALDGADAIYLSLDIDVIDPGMAPGTGTPEPGGMLTREVLRAIRQIVGSGRARRHGHRGGLPAVRSGRNDGDGRQSGGAGGDQRPCRPQARWPSRSLGGVVHRYQRARATRPRDRRGARPPVRPRPGRRSGRPRPVPCPRRAGRRADPRAGRRDGTAERAARRGRVQRHRGRPRPGDAGPGADPRDVQRGPRRSTGCTLDRSRPRRSPACQPRGRSGWHSLP